MSRNVQSIYGRCTRFSLQRSVWSIYRNHICMYHLLLRLLGELLFAFGEFVCLANCCVCLANYCAFGEFLANFCGVYLVNYSFSIQILQSGWHNDPLYGRHVCVQEFLYSNVQKCMRLYVSFATVKCCVCLANCCVFGKFLAIAWRIVGELLCVLGKLQLLHIDFASFLQLKRQICHSIDVPGGSYTNMPDVD